MNPKQKSFGAFKSPFDHSIARHTTMATALPITGGIVYSPQDIFDQYRVGKCTAIDVVQNQSKANGKKYSYDFQYLLQKKFLDGNWEEGSSNWSALQVAKTYGFLLAELWTHTTDADSEMDYPTYIAKLQAIPDAEIQRLVGLCVDKIAGFVSVDVSNPQNIASAILQSKSGIICRYEVGTEWYTPSWLPKDIDPIRPPTPQTTQGGHSVTTSAYDYSKVHMLETPNTWGTDWDLQGNCHINNDNYKMTEAYLITEQASKFQFEKDLKFGETDPDVKHLQQFLNLNNFPLTLVSGAPGSLGNETTYFGSLTLIAVRKWQLANNLPNTGLFGPMSRQLANSKI